MRSFKQFVEDIDLEVPKYLSLIFNILNLK